MSDLIPTNEILERIANGIENLAKNQQLNEQNVDLVSVYIEYLQAIRRMIYGDKDMFALSRSLRALETRTVEKLTELGYIPDEHQK